MYLSIRQKLIASSIGLLFAIGVVLLFPYWLALIAIGSMIPFFTRVLTA